MSQPFDIALPPGLTLGSGYTITVNAIDATTGNTVSGVNVGKVVLTVENLSGGNLDFGTFLLVPGPGA